MAAVDRQDRQDTEVGAENRRFDWRHGIIPSSWSGLVWLGAAIELGLLGMLLAAPRPGASFAFLVLFIAVFTCYAFAVRRSIDPAGAAAAPVRVIQLVVFFAVLFRLTLLFAAPALSTDILRYLWDGRVVAAGENPYLHSPASPELDHLRIAEDAPIEHGGVRTIYPPLAQALFTSAAVSGTGLHGLKIALVLADLLVIFVIRRILIQRRQPALRVLIYAWNPLAVIEVAWSGHLEPAGAALMLLAAGAIIQKRDLRSALALTAAGMVKLLPLVLFVPFRQALRARALLIAPLVVAIAYWPFRAAGRHLGSGLREYAGNWLANESLFGIVHATVAWIDPTPMLKAGITGLQSRLPGNGPLELLYEYVYPMDLARGVCAAAIVIFALVIYDREGDPLHGAYLLLGAILLLSPTLHPWYLLWILPWVCLFPSWSWILLTGLLGLTYINLGAPGRAAEPYPWIRWVIFVPFYSLLVAEWFRHRPRPVQPRTLPAAAAGDAAGPA